MELSEDEGYMTPPEDLFGPVRDCALTLFPNICLEYLLKVAHDRDYSTDHVIEYILSETEQNRPYPKQQKSSSLKRKRSASTNEEDQEKKFMRYYSSDDRRNGRNMTEYYDLSKTLLTQDFPRINLNDLKKIWEESGRSLYPTYMKLSHHVLNWNDNAPAWRVNKYKSSQKHHDAYERGSLDQTIANCLTESKKLILEEFRAARSVHDLKVNARDAVKRQEQEEEDNMEQAKREGLIGECGCCFGDFPLNRMIHCNADSTDLHWFCRNCAKLNAETAIGMQKHEFSCMSTDGCPAGFSRDQIAIFLDEKTIVCLERLETENSLRMAGIENLESCPRCPYAAEYPPAEVDREFRCLREDCLFVSCRFCREETHIPKTCEEASKDKGTTARQKIEEAMTSALIRKCNKCGTPFIKENGCNKMTCRPPCSNVQCYICSENCDYSHFDDKSRGGKTGNCPLFDLNLAQLHEDQVRAAEAAAREQVALEHPDVAEEELEIKVSDRVKKDEEQKRKASQRPGPPPAANLFGRIPGVVVLGQGRPEGGNDHHVHPFPVLRDRLRQRQVQAQQALRQRMQAQAPQGAINQVIDRLQGILPHQPPPPGQEAPRYFGPGDDQQLDRAGRFRQALNAIGVGGNEHAVEQRGPDLPAAAPAPPFYFGPRDVPPPRGNIFHFQGQQAARAQPPGAPPVADPAQQNPGVENAGDNQAQIPGPALPEVHHSEADIHRRVPRMMHLQQARERLQRLRQAEVRPDVQVPQVPHQGIDILPPPLALGDRERREERLRLHQQHLQQLQWLRQMEQEQLRREVERLRLEQEHRLFPAHLLQAGQRGNQAVPAQAGNAGGIHHHALAFHNNPPRQRG